MKALVTGATGFIGRHLTRDLVRNGVSVRALIRNEDRARVLPEVAEFVRGDMTRPSTLEHALRGVDTVFHLASAMRGDWDLFRRVDVDGSRRLLNSAREMDVRRFVYASTLAVYPFGDMRRGSVVDESTPVDSLERLAPYARAKLLVEQALSEAADGDELEGVVLRPGLVYGPGSDPFLGHVPHLGTRKGDRYVLFGDGRTPLPLTCVTSTACAFRLAGEVPEAAGEVFLIVDEDTPTQTEYVGALAELTGQPLKITTIPRAAGRVVGLAAELAAWVQRQPPKTTRRLIRGKWVPLRFGTSHARRLLGWAPATDFRGCLAAAIEAWNGRSQTASQSQ